VQPGFRVDAGGDIQVRGDVEAANMTSERGNITIRGGVFGRGKSRLSTPKGSMFLQMAQECELRAGLDVNLRKYLRKSLVHCRSLFSEDGEGGILSSEIYIAEQLKARKIGSSAGGA
jgi:uncharacterized protein (DUF342 family)